MVSIKNKVQDNWKDILLVFIKIILKWLQVHSEIIDKNLINQDTKAKFEEKNRSFPFTLSISDWEITLSTWE